MAVQAQYPSQGFTSRFRTDVLDDQQQQHLGTLIGLPLPLPLPHAAAGGLPVLNGTVFSEAGSELTYNASGPRKRSRDELEYVPQSTTNPAVPAIPLQKQRFGSVHHGEESTRLRQSTMTSTSGRPSSSSTLDHDIDTLIRLEYERTRAALVETTRRNCKTLLSMLGQSFQKRLKEKESELEAAMRRNQELEEKLKQVAAETQIWFNHAKNNEALVASLRTSLEQVLLQSSNTTPREGYGDSEGGVPAAAEDEGSCCFDGEAGSRRSGGGGGRGTCKACGGAEARVLVLPCRHLCLCVECEPVIGTCPVCNAVKNAGLPVFLS